MSYTPLFPILNRFIMKRFVSKTLTILFLFTMVNLILLLLIPIDKNAYVCEYNHKVELMKTTQQPRIVFIGGSNTAFGIDSKTIADSLHCNVVNFGFHAGLGIVFPIENCLQYIKKGDVVVMQLEYGNFFGGENGEPETYPVFIKSTNWRYLHQLNINQWYNVVSGVPRENIKGIVRLLRYPLRKSFDTPTNCTSFKYLKSGFNQYGDEVSHLNYPPKKIHFSGECEKRTVNKEFMEWFNDMIIKYEQAGASVILLPPVCVKSYFNASYNENISEALTAIRHPYLIPPHSMALDDSCAFDTGWHMNKDGVCKNTINIIKALKSHLH